MSKLQRKELIKGILFISPWIIGFLAFTVYPLGSAVYYSLTMFDIIRPPVFIGISNFVELAQDNFFTNSIGNTFYFAAISVPSSILVALLLALLLNKKLRFQSLWRTIFFLPSIVPVFVTAQIWRWIFHQQYGLINFSLELLGLHGIPWLGSPDWAKPSLAIISLWMCGGSMVILLAALQDVPKELMEAAQLDGASSFHQVRYITVPMISPQLLFITLNGFIGAFQTFALPRILTNGGPARSTEFMVMYLYRMGFDYERMGYASAISWIVFFITVLISIFLFYFSFRYIYYSGANKPSNS